MFLFKLLPFIKFYDIHSTVLYKQVAPNLYIVTDITYLIKSKYTNYEAFIKSFYQFYNDFFAKKYKILSISVT